VVRFVFTVPFVPVFALVGRDREVSGSGFVISPDGYILTNDHVVERANRIKVELPNRKVYPARLVGTDPFADIALLKVDLPEGETLTALPLGDSDAVREGEWVIAIGSPLGLKWTSTAGIVSAVGRDVAAAKIADFIQVEAALDMGNSGGPLINTAGEAVGINTATLMFAQNKGFAVPINIAKEVIASLKQTGQPRRGQIGVAVEEITSETVEDEGLAVEDGALVVSVAHGSAARKAGIEPGDVIVEFGGQPVVEPRDLSRLVRTAEIGKPVEVKLYRGEKAITLPVIVREMKEPFRIL